jgi:hypothetical protein
VAERSAAAAFSGCIAAGSANEARRIAACPEISLTHAFDRVHVRVMRADVVVHVL